MNQKLEKLKKHIAQFNEKQETYAEVGAYDTEPSAIFQYLLTKTCFGKNPVVPENAREWQLYYNEPKAEQAAQALTLAVRRCLDVIDPSDNDIKAYLNCYVWRVPFE